MIVIARRAAVRLGAVVLAASLTSCGGGPAGSGDSAGDRRNGRIVFSNYGREATGLFSVRHDGSGRRKLADGLVETAEVSPDGSQVALTSNSVLVGSEFDEEDPTLSSDGEHVALIEYGGHESAGRLVVVAAEGGEEIFRSPPSLNVEHAEWSPDASKLAYLTCGVSSCRLHVVAPDGSDEKVFEVDEVYDLVWAPDGSAIAFGQAIVKVLDLESGEVTRIAGDRDNQAAPLNWQPRP